MNASGRLNCRFQGALTSIGALGIILSFLPFTSNVVPFTDILLDWRFWENSVLIMAAPCILLPVPVALGYATYLVAGRLPRRAALSGYLLAAFFGLAILVDTGVAIRSDLENAWLGLLFAVAFGGAAWLGIKGTRDDLPVGSLTAMQCVYVIPMSYYLVFFAGEFQVGGWLGLVTLSAYLVQIGSVLKHPAWLLLLIVPLAGICLLLIWSYGI